MTAEEQARIEEGCILKSKEDFIKACEKEGILPEWYSFTYDASKPVCINGNSVYYGTYGVTNCAVLMRIWDIAFEQLEKYKKEYDWKQTQQPFKIDSISFDYVWYMSPRDEDIYPYITVTTSAFDNKDAAERLATGWKDGGYDRYMGEYRYYKKVDIRDNLTCIYIRFTKRTEDRDRETFGFEAEYTSGGYRYPIPSELKEEIAQFVFNNKTLPYKQQSKDLPEDLEKSIIEKYGDSLLNDEYYALRRFKETHLQALLSTLNHDLSEKEQRTRMADASRIVERRSPAYANFMDSRSDMVAHSNFVVAYKKAGIELDKRPSIKEINEKFGNVRK